MTSPSSLRVLKYVLCLALITGSAWASDEPKSIKFLTPDQVKTLVDSVPPPPAPGSAEDQADLAGDIAAEKARTPASIAEAKKDEHFSYALFASVYGDKYTEASAPKFIALLKDVQDVTRVVTDGAKDKFKRPRPYEAHPTEIHALFPAKGFSYPSGHSTGSYTQAVILGEIFPDKKQAFLDRAAQIAQSRVDAGVHNPSDIAEGEKLGKATAEVLLANADFQKELAAAKAEVSK
jgi:acid phosphatase (class A)